MAKKNGPERKKRFDCLDFKRKSQARIYAEIKDMTGEQQRAYFRKAAESGPLADWWKKVREDPAHLKDATDPAA